MLKFDQNPSEDALRLRACADFLADRGFTQVQAERILERAKKAHDEVCGILEKSIDATIEDPAEGIARAFVIYGSIGALIEDRMPEVRNAWHLAQFLMLARNTLGGK